MIIREATVPDISALSAIRMSVKENKLSNPERITVADYERYLTINGRGWLCEMGGHIVGFSIVDMVEGNVWALFVLPDYEGRGIGRILHNVMLDWYFDRGKEQIWLSTGAGTRAERYYRSAGWQHDGMVGLELRFVMTIERWKELILQR